VYAPVELMKKDEKTGKLSPYMEGGGAPIKWEDGSVQADLPMQRLSELFNINHFIVSQVSVARAQRGVAGLFDVLGSCKL
jgi:TAG lipase/steryl ester hydrolase/phospholipase A2/LPA acyltransferase